jgi:hypothetical protein
MLDVAKGKYRNTHPGSQKYCTRFILAELSAKAEDTSVTPAASAQSTLVREASSTEPRIAGPCH